MRTDFVYCPYCGIQLERRNIFGQLRPHCAGCGYVQFPDPKVAVIGLVTWADHVLLIKRAIEPMIGFWALPGGYMDAGEMPQGALARELQEEVGLNIDVGALLDIFPMVGREADAQHGAEEWHASINSASKQDQQSALNSQGIVLAFHVAVAQADQPMLSSDDDVSDAKWFVPDELPKRIAFESTHVLLRRWQDDLLSVQQQG